MKLISVIVFYSEKAEESGPKEEKRLLHRLPKKETRLGSKIQQLKYELANFPLGMDTAVKQKRSSQSYELDLGPEISGSGYDDELTSVEINPVLVPPPVKLKTECCEKYLKGKRCGRCPCFDLPNGPASRLN